MSPLSGPDQTKTRQHLSRRSFITQMTMTGVFAVMMPSILAKQLFASPGADEALLNIAENIVWTGQASVKLPGLGANIYVDPFNLKAEDKADIVLITHSHQDHLSLPSLKKICTDQTIIIAPEDVASQINTLPKKETRIVAPGDRVKLKHILVQAVPMYNITKTQYHPKSRNWVGYTITGNGITVYHAGDTERIPEMKDIRCDIALLPLGQTYTMDSVEDAVKSAMDVKAKLAVPIHYGMYEGSKNDADKFKAGLTGTMDVVILAQQP